MILITKNDRRIGDLVFRRQVRDTLREVEEIYWRLVQARRDVVITARLLAEFEAIYEYLVARQDFDITPVQIAALHCQLSEVLTQEQKSAHDEMPQDHPSMMPNIKQHIDEVRDALAEWIDKNN